MTLRRVTQLELEDFITVHDIGSDDDAGTDMRPLSAEEVRLRSLAARQVLEERDEADSGADWAGAYHNLINAGWPWRIAAWVAWSTVPKTRRCPKTQQELAVDVLGLGSDRVIAKWRKKFPTLDQMIADLQADEMLTARADVFNALKISASTVDYKHSPDRRLFLTMSGDYVEHNKLTLTGGKKAQKSLKDLSDAELDALSGDPDKVRAYLAELRNEVASDDDGADIDE
jgi:hypothetical protein